MGFYYRAHSCIALIHSLDRRRELVGFLEIVSARYPSRHDLRDAVERYRIDLESVEQGIPREGLGPGQPTSAGPSEGVTNQTAESAGILAQNVTAGLQSLDGTSVGSFAALPYLDPPDLPVWVSRRAETLDDLVPELESATWVVIRGGARTGKTILTRLITDRFGGATYWLRLGGMEAERAAGELDRALSAIAGSGPTQPRNSWYSTVCGRIGAGKALVIEDLPELEVNSPLWVRLEPLVRAFYRSGVRMFSTTLKAVPPTLFHQFAGIPTASFVASPLTEGETEEVLIAHGAPAEFVSSDSRLIHAFCREHPFLIVAACLYLRRRGWRLASAELNAIVGAKHTETIAEDVLRRLKATIPDGRTRGLLYRLSLVGERFDVDLVDELASVTPLIDRARERLRELDGPWLERHPDGLYEVSPLLTQIGQKQLSALRRKNCHRKIASTLVRGRMNQHKTFLAISHYARAEEFDKAGTLLVLMLAAANRETGELPDHADFPASGRPEPLPATMDLNIKLLVRGAQLAAFKKIGRSLDYPLDDLVALQSQTDGNHRFGLSGALSYAAFAASPTAMLRLCTVARTYLSVANAPLPRGQLKRKRNELSLREDEFYTFERVVLVLVLSIETSEHLQAWVELVALLPLDQRKRLFWAEADVLSFPAAGDFLINAELRKPAEARDWSAVLGALERMAARGRSIACDELWASAIRSRILVLAGQLGDVSAALSVAEEALDYGSNSALARFLINAGIGERLVWAGEEARARGFLERALEQDAIPPFHEKLTALLATSRAVGSVNPDAAVAWAEKAVAAAEHLRIAVPLEEVKALAELGIAQFYRGGVAEAFPTWDRAAEVLLGLRSEKDAWKDLFVLFGHATGYLARLASSGEPPSETGAGDEYVGPKRGMFLSENRSRLEYFREGNVRVLPYLISVYAAGVGNRHRAAHWRERTVRDAPAEQLTLLQPAILRDDVPEMLHAGRVRELIHQSRKAAWIIVTLGAERAEGAFSDMDGPALEEAVSGLDVEAQRRVNSSTALMGVIPTVLYLATLHVEEASRARADEVAKELIAGCRALCSPPDHPAYWEQIVQPIEMAFMQDVRQPEILRWKGTLCNVVPEREALVFLAMAANATAEEAITVLLPILKPIEAWYPPRSEIHRALLVPYVEKYWMTCFAQMRFRFRSPQMVEMLLADACKEPEEKRIRAILRAVLNGFWGPAASGASERG